MTYQQVKPAQITIDGIVYDLEPARIESTTLGYEDHGIVTAYLQLDYGNSSGQGAGGYGLDEPIRDEQGNFIGRRGTAYGLDWIIRVLDVCGADSWEKLPGKPVYALKPDHFMIRGLASWPHPSKTLVFETHAKQFRREEKK